MNKIKTLFVGSPVFASVIIFGTGVSLAFAQSGPINTQGDLKNFLCSIITWFIWILIAISIIMVLVAAFDYITAGDDAEKVSTARKRITYAAVGVAVALIAVGFPAVVATVFPNSTSTSAFTCGSNSGSSSNTGTYSSTAGAPAGQGYLP